MFKLRTQLIFIPKNQSWENQISKSMHIHKFYGGIHFHVAHLSIKCSRNMQVSESI